MGKFNFIETGIEGLVVVEPSVYGDERGYFMETYNERDFDNAGQIMRFVQDNQSCSKKGVLRGLHMQVKNPQGKLVRVIRGEVYDVGVDMRPGSPTQGNWYGTILSADNKCQMFVPEGFAHGFLVLSDEAEFIYKCTRLYDGGDELGIRYDDPVIGIKWPDAGVPYLLSDKDLALGSYRDACRLLES